MIKTHFTTNEIATLCNSTDAHIKAIGYDLLKARMPLLAKAVDTAPVEAKAKETKTEKIETKAKKEKVGESKAKLKAKKDGKSISQVIRDVFGKSKQEFSIDEIMEVTGFTRKETRDSLYSSYRSGKLESSANGIYNVPTK